MTTQFDAAATHRERELILAEVERRRFWLAMKRALVLVLDGETYRAAAKAEGVGYRELHRNAATVPGLRAAHLAAWRELWGTAFPAVWRQHLRDIDRAA